MENKIEQLRKLIQESHRIVFFGGAGISTESQIPDFRGTDGIYQDSQKYPHPPEVMLSHSFFERHPAAFFAFYYERMLYPAAQPNPGHLALTRLEKQGKLTAIITQNVDGLHQKAGNRTVLELHGSVLRNHCTSCGAVYDLDFMLKHKAEGIPRCERCGEIVRPDIVLYEECLNQDVMEESVTQITNADLLIVGGTALAVYPAAGLIRYFSGENLVLINKTPTSLDSSVSLVLHESIGLVLDSAIS